MEKYRNLKKSTKIGFLICLILAIAGLVVTAVSLVGRIAKPGDTIVPIFHDAVNLLIYIFVFYYVLIGYKIPHGNLLRGLFFGFSVNLILQITMPKPAGKSGVILYLSMLCIAFGALIIAYMAGRLNKIEKNKKLLIVSGFLLLAGCCLSVINRSFEIRRLIVFCEPIIVHAALGLAYTARYEEHKAAGLEEK